MSTLWKATLVTTLFVGFGACSQVKFDKIANCQNSGLNCELICTTEDDCIEAFSNTVTVSNAQVDILIIMDNSGSMSPEQTQMANRFSNFFDQISGLDYHLAITTTDVLASDNDLALAGYQPPYSGAPAHIVPVGGVRGPRGGYYQNGRFLEFQLKGPQKFLHGDLGTPSEVENAFLDTLDGIRAQTEYCESQGFSQKSCASGDERGIYALNMALENNKEAGFFRPLAHLAVIIVSDEDERSNTKIFGNVVSPDNGLGYPSLNSFADEDLPEAFISRLSQRFSSSKTLGVHSIVVNNSTCAQQQRSQFLNPTTGSPGGAGNIGHLYMRFAEMTGGHVGSVCASDYGQQLGNIGSTVVDQVSTVGLACRPIDDIVYVEFLSQPAPNVTVIEELDQKRIRFEPMLPPGTQLRVHYECYL